jgi:hypothetical protein
LAFEANQGQAAAPINFVAHGSGYALALTPSAAVLALQKSVTTPGAQTSAAPGDVVQLQLLGANPAAPVTGLDELITKSNYYLGNDPSQWHTNIPNFGEVEYQNVYAGINLVYYGNQGQLEYDFVLAAGANPGAITLSVQGTQGMTLDGQGNLVLHTAGGNVLEQAPVLYQELYGVRQAVSGRFVLGGNNQVGFQVGAYDPSRPLVIDAVLSYSTYLGGRSDDQAQAIAMDGSGNAYVTGWTSSNNFPTANAFQPTLEGSGYNAFVTKLNATGTALVYSTYVNGSLAAAGDKNAATFGLGIAVDSAGNAYVMGSTSAVNFPTTSGAFQTSYPGGKTTASVSKFNSSGGLVYSTYLGGNGSGWDGAIDTSGAYFGNPIAVDGSGDAYVVGETNSTNFPTTSNAYQTAFAGDPSGYDGYITELNASGSGLVYSTFLSGGPADGIAVNAGEVYVTGTASSTSFPTTANAYQKSFSGYIGPAFVAVLNPSLPAAAQLVYATYLGSYFAAGSGIAVDSSGNAYITGNVQTSNFPTTPGAFDTTYPPGASLSFVAKINPFASGFASLVYSTYLGGGEGNAIAVDSLGNAYVAGDTGTGFPTTANAIQTSPGQATLTGFVTTLNASGSALLYSTYLGGTDRGDSTFATGIALDGSGNIYVTGWVGGSRAVNFPTTSGAMQTKYGGGSNDAFVTKISAVVGGGAAPPANLGKEPSVDLTANPLSLTSVGANLDPILTTQGGLAPQQTVLHPVLLDGSESAASRQSQPADTGTFIPSPRPWLAGKRSAAEIRDRVFAEMGTEPDSGVLATDLSARWIG